MILAQNLTLPGGTTISGPSGLTKTFGSGAEFTIGKLISNAIPFIFAFAGIGLLLMLIFGGFGVLTSSGDAKKLAGASQRITYAILGFIVIFVAYWAVQLAGKIFGLQTGF